MIPAKSRKKDVVIVISSECTWHNLSRFCFNANFYSNRNMFDLCIVFNGAISESLAIINGVTPDYLFNRPNCGMDPAALDFALKSLPPYENYIIMHDDHWFNIPYWFSFLTELLHNETSVDAFGNLVTSCPYNSESFDAFFELVSSVITGSSIYTTKAYPYYLQGMAGIFRARAIQKLLQRDGVPHTHCNNKKTAEVCERLVSYVLLNEQMVLKQIPPGYELFLRHREHNHALAELHSPV